MNGECLVVSAFVGERDAVRGGRFLADELLDVYERHALDAGVLLRGTEGFGIGHRLRTQRLVTLSEDLPVVAIGVGSPGRVEPVVDEIRGRLRFRDGLITLERCRMLAGGEGVRARSAWDGDGGEGNGAGAAVKLTIYCGRGERVRGRPAAGVLVDLLRRHGVAGATVFLGVDGLVHGVRRRARFFSRNADVPVVVVAVGAGGAIGRAVEEIGGVLETPLVTVERVRLIKRDGERLGDVDHVPEQDSSGRPVWQKLTVYAGEQARFEGGPLYVELVRRLREGGAAGATVLRGVWGYHGDHAPHGDRLLSLRRRVPVVTVVVDRPEEIRRVWPIVDGATAATGLVTSERVPAFLAAADGAEHGVLAPALPSAAR